MAKTKKFRRSDRGNRTSKIRFLKKSSYKTRRNTAKLDDLPCEIILKIFSYLSLEDLYKNVRLVCNKWLQIASVPCLWQFIKAGPEISTNLLLNWLTLAPKLKTLEIFDRPDGGYILRKVTKCNKQLEEITVNNCWGSFHQVNLPSEPLCNLLVRCPNLHKISLQDSRFVSCKFFKLLATRQQVLSRKKQRPRKRHIESVTFLGNASLKQLRVFLKARKDANTHRLTRLSVEGGENNLAQHHANENLADSDGEIDRIIQYLN